MPTLPLPTRRDQAGVTILTSSLSPPSLIALQQRTSERMRGVGRKGKEGAEGMRRGFLRAFLFALRAALGEERWCPCLPTATQQAKPVLVRGQRQSSSLSHLRVTSAGGKLEDCSKFQ